MAQLNKTSCNRFIICFFGRILHLGIIKASVKWTDWFIFNNGEEPTVATNGRVGVWTTLGRLALLRHNRCQSLSARMQGLCLKIKLFIILTNLQKKLIHVFWIFFLDVAAQRFLVTTDLSDIGGTSDQLGFSHLHHKYWGSLKKRDSKLRYLSRMRQK